MPNSFPSQLTALIQHLSAYTPLSAGYRDFLSRRMELRPYNKRELLLREGQVCRYAWFLHAGLLRCFYTKDEQDISSWFMTAGHIAMDPQSMYDQVPSQTNLEALENCYTLRISYPDIDEAFNHYPEANIIARKVADVYYRKAEARLTTIRMRTAIDRYRYLQENEPELIKRVPLKYLSTYLDLDATSLSKIRRKI